MPLLKGLISEDRNPKFVIKRDGSSSEFEIEKIYHAILASANETEEFGDNEALTLTTQVLKVLRYRFEGKSVNLEQIQDIIEQTLISSNHFATAKAFMIYRQKRATLRKDKQTLVDVEKSMNEYLDQLDWRVKANANVGYSLGGMILNTSGKITANYWLSHVYPEKIGECHRNGDFYIHDLDMLSGYCAGWSLRMLLEEGLNGVPGHIEAKPPKHMSSAMGQIVNFLGTLQNEWAGAQAFSSVDTYLAPFIRLDNLSYERVKQEMQQMLHFIGTPSRWGTQTPFINFTFDWVCPEDLRGKNPIIGGKEVTDFTYGDLQEEMNMINRAFIECMTEGDAKGRLFTFPIPTYNITKDFPWDDPNTDLLFDMTAKYGIPYFQNFVNSDLNPTDVRSMCCRLQLDLRELLKRGGGLFGSGEQTGSIGVVTINCARLGYVHKGNEEALFERANELMELAKQSLEMKRKTVQRYMDGGLYPFSKRYLGSLRSHFSTIGVNGINEMIRNFTNDKEDITTKFGQDFALRFLDNMRDKMVHFQEETGNLYNLEATPAEGTTYKLAREDKKRFGDDIIQAGTEDAPYYTNSSQLPVGFSDDMFEAMDLQEDLQRKYTGGTVFHMYMGERISDGDACKSLLKKVTARYKMPYFTVTPRFSICPKHGYLKGEHKFCPKCDEELIARKSCSCSK
ncbi:MAG: ribonucleoside triphosphate reductase [Alphaproteobacteria bacterium]|nr:ribonucleoside triphosphate reductase [Alphaproteobacteria bacterium]